MNDYSKLELLAEAATPGPWSYDGSYVCPARAEDGTTYVETWRSVADCHQPENTKFIAAANPAAVLALIAENKRLAALLECAQGDLKQAMQIIEKDGKDAERYRFLRRTKSWEDLEFDDCKFWIVNNVRDEAGYEILNQDGSMLDEVVDAAMSKETGHDR